MSDTIDFIMAKTDVSNLKNLDIGANFKIHLDNF